MLVFFILLSLFLSALFSGTEIAFLTSNKLFVKLQESKGSRAGRILAKFYENKNDFLSTLLVGNNIALVVFSSLMTMPLERFLRERMHWENQGLILLVQTLIITLLVLVFGEFLPKTIFRLYADKLLITLAVPLKFIKSILSFPAWVMTSLSKFIISKVMGATYREVEEPLDKSDLENFILSVSSEKDEEIDTALFTKALNLHEIQVRDCMVPRTEIEGLSEDSSFEELIALFKKSKHSRLIVYKEDIDEITGYVHHQDLFTNPSPHSIQDVLREIMDVPESMKVHQLLHDFVEEHKNIAWVIDEYGGTAGIITLEDIVEEIFGEIEDEHDIYEGYKEEVLGEGKYLFSARLEIDYLNEKYPELHLPEGEYHTLSGYLVMTLGRIPEKDEEIVLDHLKFTVKKVDGKKIEEVLVALADGAGESAQEGKGKRESQENEPQNKSS